jgi:hypothetical protein
MIPGHYIREKKKLPKFVLYKNHQHILVTTSLSTRGMSRVVYFVFNLKKNIQALLTFFYIKKLEM